MWLPKGGTFRLELEGNSINEEKEVLRGKNIAAREPNLSRPGGGSECGT